jgi:hypothetical protein
MKTHVSLLVFLVKEKAHEAEKIRADVPWLINSKFFKELIFD